MRTHWRITDKSGHGITGTDPAKLIVAMLNTSAGRQFNIVEGEKDGAFFRIAYSAHSFPRSFNLTRAQARGYVADPSTIAALTPFAERADA